MEVRKIFTLISIAALLTFIAACRHCMCCGPIYGNIYCILGNDTITRETNPGTPNGNIVDSLNFYRGKGFSCSSNIAPLTYASSPSCGRAEIGQQESMGYGCTNTNDDGDCN